jgi:hypothetical protein
MSDDMPSFGSPEELLENALARNDHAAVRVLFKQASEVGTFVIGRLNTTKRGDDTRKDLLEELSTDKVWTSRWNCSELTTAKVLRWLGFFGFDNVPDLGAYFALTGQSPNTACADFCLKLGGKGSVDRLLELATKCGNIDAMTWAIKQDGCTFQGLVNADWELDQAKRKRSHPHFSYMSMWLQKQMAIMRHDLEV